MKLKNKNEYIFQNEKKKLNKDKILKSVTNHFLLILDDNSLSSEKVLNFNSLTFF